MSDAPEDLDNLFDEVSSQRAASQGATETQTVIEATQQDMEKIQQAASAVGIDVPMPTDSPVLNRLGGIVRQLHDALKALGYDEALAERLGEIVDSQERLEYIAVLTEQAANKVFNAIDQSIPAQERLSSDARDIEDRWDLLYNGKMSIEEFKLLAGDSKAFAARVRSDADAEKARLLDMMMAQDFQDITGQIIKKIVAISKKLERDLAQLLIDHAPRAANKEKTVDLLAGPDVPTNAMGQTDVDDLLDELGF